MEVGHGGGFHAIVSKLLNKEVINLEKPFVF